MDCKQALISAAPLARRAGMPRPKIRAVFVCRARRQPLPLAFFMARRFFMLLPTSFAMPHSLTGAAPLPR